MQQEDEQNEDDRLQDRHAAYLEHMIHLVAARQGQEDSARKQVCASRPCPRKLPSLSLRP
jgi:hypothetical protein